TRVEASAHGGRRLMDIGGGLPEIRGTQAVVYAEAGKHAHWAAPEHMGGGDRERLAALCGPLAGIEGVHLGNPFAQRGAYVPTARDHRLARLSMRGDAFVPSHCYRPPDTVPALMRWRELEAAIPG